MERSKRGRVRLTPTGRLTRRQREVLFEIAVGGRDIAIAKRLGISYKTLIAHKCNIYEALGVHNETGAVWRAYCIGLIDIEAAYQKSLRL